MRLSICEIKRKLNSLKCKRKIENVRKQLIFQNKTNICNCIQGFNTITFISPIIQRNLASFTDFLPLQYLTVFIEYVKIGIFDLTIGNKVGTI